MTDLFTTKAPRVMADLMQAFGLAVEDAAAVLGNIGHECNGFATMQEVRPLVPGSAGGYGWCQWTASRRRSFEAFCKTLNLDPAGDKANYGYLVEELRGSERGAIAKVKAAPDLSHKVIAFERAFLRAGIPHYDSRLAWAQKALAAFKAVPVPPPPDVEPTAPPARISGLCSAIKSRLKGA